MSVTCRNGITFGVHFIIQSFIITIHWQKWASSDRGCILYIYWICLAANFITSNNPNKTFIDFRLNAIQFRKRAWLSFFNVNRGFSTVYQSVWEEGFLLRYPASVCCFHVCQWSGLDWGLEPLFLPSTSAWSDLQLQIRRVRMSSSVMFPQSCCFWVTQKSPLKFGGLLLISVTAVWACRPYICNVLLERACPALTGLLSGFFSFCDLRIWRSQISPQSSSCARRPFLGKLW